MIFRLPLALTALTASSFAADAPEKITPVAVRENYRAFYARVTNKPKSIGAEFAESGIGSPGQEQMGRETGPHATHYLHYYLNGTAQLHRDARSGTAYPSGSVIVMEKLWGGYAGREDTRNFRILEPAPDFTRITAVAGMIKRRPGSSPTTGDWEFFYFSGGPVSANGKPITLEKAKDLQSCASCHRNAPDMVFGRFNEPYKMPKSGENRSATRKRFVIDPKK